MAKFKVGDKVRPVEGTTIYKVEKIAGRQVFVREPGKVNGMKYQGNWWDVSLFVKA